MPEANSQKGGPVFYTCYTETLFAESKLNFDFVWESASAWKPISHCKLFVVIWYKIVLCLLHIDVVEGPPLVHLHIIFALFWKTISFASEFIKCGSWMRGPNLLKNFGEDKVCVICMLLCISHKYSIIVCVSMTLPCSLNRSQWLYGSCIEYCASTWLCLLHICFFTKYTEL